jgi:hypothetical protein
MSGLLQEAFADRGDTERMRSLVQEMQERLGDGGDDRARAELDEAAARVLYLDERLEASLERLDRATAGFERAGARERFQRAISDRAYVLWLLGRRRESRMLFRGILALATEEGDLRSMSAAWIAIGLAAEDWRGGMESNLEAAVIARRGGYGGTEMVALANAAEAAVEFGDWPRADELLEDLRARPDLPSRLADALMMDAVLLAAYRGDRAAAEAALASVSDETAASGDPTMRAWHHRTIAVARLMVGDVDSGYEEAMIALDAEPTGPNAPMALWCAGRAALWLHDPDRVRAALDRGPALEGGWQGSTRRALEAGLEALEGQPRDAAAAYESFLAERVAKGDRFTHALATVDAVEVLPAELVPEGAVETARDFLERLGAEPLLARLARAGVREVSEA